MITNPPLDAVYIAHFGVKGMKWGRRKTRPDEAQRKQIFKNAEQKKKVIAGLAVVGGAVAVGVLLSKRGRNKVTDVAVTNYVQQRTARAQAGNNPFGQLARKFRDTKAASVPSPQQMMAEAQRAGVEQRSVQRVNRLMTDRNWRQSANFNKAARESLSSDVSLDEVRRRLQDPNYVWEL